MSSTMTESELMKHSIAMLLSSQATILAIVTDTNPDMEADERDIASKACDGMQMLASELQKRAELEGAECQTN